MRSIIHNQIELLKKMRKMSCSVSQTNWYKDKQNKDGSSADLETMKYISTVNYLSVNLP